MKYNTEFVLRVNEVYHDVEGRQYEDKHEEIFDHEAKRWQRIARDFISADKKISVLDIGSGTGFVPLQIGGVMKRGDRVTCSDLSAGILKTCEQNVKGKFKCTFAFKKLDGKKLPLKANSVDVVTMNSVLHHIPDFHTFFSEIDRVLKKGGKIIFGHEPNKRFYSSFFLRNNSRLIGCVFSPVQGAAAVLRKIGLFDIARKAYQAINKDIKADNKIMDEVNRQLIKEGRIKKPMSSAQIIEIVDIESPTAGGFHKERGIDVKAILRKHLKGYSLEHIETYAHLENASQKNRLTREYDRVLREAYPTKGSTLLAILRKD